MVVVTGGSGRAGAYVGAACLAAGLSGAGFAFWAGSPAERQTISLLSRGLSLGVLGTLWVVFRPG